MRVTKRRSAGLATAMAAVALLAAGCGSSSSSSTSGGSATNAAAPAGVKSASVRLFTIVPLSGPTGSYPEVAAAANAAAKAVNAAGGIHGRPVSLTICDNQGSPNQQEACAREAVAAHALAAAGTFTGVAGNYVSVLQAAGIPNVGVNPNNPPEVTGPPNFPVQSNQTDVVGFGQLCVKLGDHKVAGAYVDFPSAKFLLLNNIAIGLKSGGLTLAKSLPVPATQTDYSSVAAALMAGGTNCIAGVLTSTGSPLLVNALHEAGYKGAIVLDSGAVTSKALQDLGSAADGLYLVGPVLPVTETTDPGVQQFTKELANNGDSEPIITGAAAGAWASIHLIANLMNAAPAADVNSATLMKDLGASGSQSLGPLAPFNLSQRVTWFPPGTDLYAQDVAVTQVHNGVQKVQFGGKFVDAAQMPALSG